MSTEMDICLEMVISYWFLFLAFIIDQNVSAEESRCGAHGPTIRFPFRLNSQPENDGYPGFTLSCTHTNQTMLELPISVKLFVKEIDYKSQVIQLYDPHHCFPRGLRGLDLSSSHFQFKLDSPHFLYDYALFNCSPRERQVYYYYISCLSGPTYKVFAHIPDGNGMSLGLLHCTKMYTLRSIPYVLIELDPEKFLQLNWSTPACKHCEAKGMRCMKSNSSDSGTRCISISKVSKHTKGTALWKLEISTGVIFGSIVLLLAIFSLYHFYTHDKVEKEHQAKIEIFLEDYRNFKPTRYLYTDIKMITNQFTEKLGEGAYGTVFKRKLSNEIYVAVKILNTSNENGEEFINEVGTIGKIHHVNVVRLVGFCVDGFRQALVYEFLPNDSLEKFISSTYANKCFLSWDKLHDIALGVAKGIEYLHQGCNQRILHFDIKPHNILLDQNFNPKISDFGLSKLCSKDQSVVSMTTAKGTIGYIAPEVFFRNFGNVSSKADVYSFGMLLLEIVEGRKNVDNTVESTSQVYFPEWIYNLLEQKEDIQITADDDGDAKIAKKLAIIGLWCIQWHPMDRPLIKDVVQMLEGEGDQLTMPPNPFASTSYVKINANIPTKRLHHELEVISELE